MGKILLIEPYKILQQAISLAVFPEHEVMVEEGLSASGVGSLKDYDLLIVDGAALRERNQLTPEVARMIQGCKTPILWLEEDESSHPPKREKLVMVKKPVERAAFQSALAGLLSSSGTSRGQSSSLAPTIPGAGRPKGAPKQRRAEVPQQATFEFIDLVDVVEEQPPPRQGRKAPRKSK